MIKITQSWRRFEAFNLNKRPLYSTRTTLWMFIRNCCRCCWQSVRSVIARAHGNDSRGNLTSLAQQTADARGLQPSLSLSLSLSLCLSVSFTLPECSTCRTLTYATISEQAYQKYNMYELHAFANISEA